MPERRKLKVTKTMSKTSAADRHAADQRRIAELADDAEADDADERRRQIGERHRQRDGEHAAVGYLEGSYPCKGHSATVAAALSRIAA